LLNGGYLGWLKAGGTEEVGRASPSWAVFRATPRGEVLATKGHVLGLLKSRAEQILDARSEPEHCGDAGMARRKSHIPGSKNLEWTQVLDRDGRFLNAPELLNVFRKAGIDPKRPATTYCESGGRSSVLAFAFELAGGRPARNYYRSWSEWGNDPETPIAVPPK